MGLVLLLALFGGSVSLGWVLIGMGGFYLLAGVGDLLFVVFFLGSLILIDIGRRLGVCTTSSSRFQAESRKRREEFFLMNPRKRADGSIVPLDKHGLPVE